MMKVYKINHRQQDRIMPEFPFDREKAALIKQIAGAGIAILSERG